MADTIGNLCFKLNLRGKYEHMVGDFAKAQGDDVVLAILTRIYKAQQVRLGNGVYAKSAVMQWKEAVDKHLLDKRVNAKSVKEAGTREDAKQEYYATVKSGYVPNGETLAEQLEQQYADNEINAEAYRLGMVGLDVVHGYVAAAQGKGGELPF